MTAKEILHQMSNASTQSNPIWKQVGVPSRGESLFEMLANGFSYDTVQALLAEGLFQKSEFINITGIAPATLDRRKRDGHLNTVESDKVYRLLRIIDSATELFSGDQQKAVIWCRSQARGLGDRAPIDMVRTSAGTEAVIDYIGRIEHGVIS
ncbi:type II toxin-antitoxin system antitoxin Xre [Arenicella sp. 4NH20-0111]|uniref:type II RES/Xre toxin-antitoxin system antitoxin n=1 Tax=Arenicella sp. 4NH20-0111 TaxID=3127648 RepID=UPI003101EA20